MSLFLKIDASELVSFNRVFARYLELNTRERPAILAHIAQQIAVGNNSKPGAYLLTRAAAPTPEKILAEAKARNWRTMFRGSARHRATVRSFATGQMGGEKSVMGSAGKGVFARIDVASVSARGRILRKADRATGTRAGAFGLRGGPVIPGAADARGAMFDRLAGKYKNFRGQKQFAGAGLTSFNRRNFEVTWEIFFRQRAVRHTASGWLTMRKMLTAAERKALKSAGGSIPGPTTAAPQTFFGRAMVARASGVAGTVELTSAPGVVSLLITNKTPGMAVLDKRRGILRQAVANARADMEIYVARKAQERAEKELSKKS